MVFRQIFSGYLLLPNKNDPNGSIGISVTRKIVNASLFHENMF
jgi:hypothetical protein